MRNNARANQASHARYKGKASGIMKTAIMECELEMLFPILSQGVMPSRVGKKMLKGECFTVGNVSWSQLYFTISFPSSAG